MNSYLKCFSMDKYSIIPKYRQLMKAIIAGLDSGELLKGDQLPSIHDLCVVLELSKNTVEKAYNQLKKLGIVSSAHGKGYFLQGKSMGEPLKVLLLFNQLSSNKKVIYDAFTSTLGKRAVVDFHSYNNDAVLFKKILLEKQEQYHKIVVIPHFSNQMECPSEALNTIPKEKLVLLDKMITGVRGDFSAVYEDFGKDIYEALEMLLDRLSGYRELILVVPEHIYFAEEVISGFKKFCIRYSFRPEIYHQAEQCILNAGQAYILLLEEHLVQLIERMMATAWKAGADIGLISYNETPLKRVILDGITTISTDFELMGKLAAECVCDNESRKIAVPFGLKRRNSL